MKAGRLPPGFCFDRVGLRKRLSKPGDQYIKSATSNLSWRSPRRKQYQTIQNKRLVEHIFVAANHIFESKESY
jgi:hypothetical protein